STMIPSSINLMIGGTALMRGLPGIPQLLVRFMPVGKSVPKAERQWMAAVLASQWVGGIILGLFVQVVTVIVVIGHIMPWLGWGLLDMARDLAALDLPGQIIALFR
ncbi:MAG: hypothetical protein ABSG76_22345, partial [Xanthobacteraceae bacterium]